MDPEQSPTNRKDWLCCSSRTRAREELETRDRARNERERKARRKGKRGRRRGEDECWAMETAGWRDWCGPEEKKPLVA